MVRSFKSLAVVGLVSAALSIAVSPAFAEKMLNTPVGDFDLDPFNILAPAAPAAVPPARAEPAPVKKPNRKKKKKM